MSQDKKQVLDNSALPMIQSEIIARAHQLNSDVVIDIDWILEQIDEMAAKPFFLPFHISAEQIKTIVNGVRAEIDVTVREPGVIVDNKKEHIDWYTEERLAQTDRFFWLRFEKYIKQKNDIPLSVLKRTDLDTDKILSNMHDPMTQDSFLTRGMVIGDVQAGKTLNYSALINKSCDMGYKLVIVLTGLTEDLRSQTQRRLDRDFVGQESQQSGSGVSIQGAVKLGVGNVDFSKKLSAVLTDKNSDFRSPRVMNMESDPNPVLIVAKKNKSILEEINRWLRAQNGTVEKKLECPVLIIDDEADNASVNTGKPDEEPRAINRAIRTMLSLCKKVSYVAYTATPFANIFIAPDEFSSAKELKELFPEDFIIALSPPSNYCGGKFFFVDESTSIKVTKEIEDAEEYIPIKHKSDFNVTALPPSLIDAVRLFFVASAIKDIRRKREVINVSNPDNRFDTCLINVSRLINIQNDIKPLVMDEVDNIYTSIKANTALASTNDSIFNKLKKLFMDEYADDVADSITWDDVCEAFQEMVKPIVVAIHGQSDDALLWESNSPTKVIAIGGFRLSRGLTLSGLTISYLYRNSLMYDTLMQMGRWFGYRDGYKDLLRLWCSADSIDWYAHITNATEELRESVALMAKQKLTPNDFGLRVLSHPGLLVTAKNKMQTGKEVEVKISFSGALRETYAFDLSDQVNNFNKDLVVKLIEDCLDKKTSAPTNQDQHVFMSGVDGDLVISFLKDYKVNNLNGDWSAPELFHRYLDEVRDSDLQLWDVCIFNKKGSNERISPDLSDLAGKNIHLQQRSVFYRAGIEKYSKAFFVNGNRKLSTGSIDKIGLESNEDRTKPMLVIHAIEAKDPGVVLPEKLKNCIGKIYYGCSVMLPVTKNEVKAISYKVTQGWLRRYMPESDESNELAEVEEF
jgi:hypothetical protein